MRAIALFFYRFGMWLYFKLHICQFWSGLYRFIWERKFLKVQLRTYSDLQTLGDYLRNNAGKWTADSWKQLWDAVSYPQKAQEAFDGNLKADSGLDCDEFAIYSVAVLEKSLAQGTLHWRVVADPRLLTVMWQGKKAGGHNVCLVLLPEKNLYAFMDYGVPRGEARTPAEVARNVVDIYAGKDATVAMWAISKSNLSPVEVHWGP